MCIQLRGINEGKREKSMKKIFRKVLFGMVLCAVCFAGFCGTQAQAALKLNKKSAAITVGKTVKLKVKGTSKKVKWTSSNKAVCTVNKKGLVKGKKAGSAVIRAKVKKRTLKCKVTVKAKSGGSQTTPKPTPTPTPKPTPTPSPTGLRVTGPYSILAPGGTMQLSLGYVPVNAKKEAVEWYSSNRDRATVSSSGLVTAKKEGEVTITAELKSNDDIRASFKFRIQNLEATGEVNSENGGDLLLSDNRSKAVFEYTISFTTPNVQTQVLDGIGNVVRTWSMGTLGAEKPAKVVWDLKNANGTKVPAGSYCFQIVAAGAKIKSSYFTVYAKSDFDAGNGSPESPYEVSTLEQLKLVEEHNGVCFKQTANIDANLTEITPLFTADVPFVGTYDGGNYSIMNVSNMMNSSNVGIFSAVGKDGIVQNVVIENSYFNGIDNVGALIGVNEGTVNNCTINSCGLTSSNGKSGAIAALNSGTIRNCKTRGNTLSSTHDVGGISGYSKGVIIDCVSEENNLALTVQRDVSAGGIAGANLGNVINCTSNSIKLNSSYNWTKGAGIAGYNSGTVTNSKVKDLEISGSWQWKGGVIGFNRGNNTNNTYTGTLNQTGN